ncbi:MAG: phenylalanine 4-monooxygenase [Rhodothermales bacterium]|nr:phenylalanine 4-monooxygenase [Rhodothermales bacterium]MBO6778480.1 phenylalanine 4-monooxygenase [Rhodothermales bacterium]
MDAVLNLEDTRSAYEKAADEGIDPRCVPQNLEDNPPIGPDIVAPEYSALEHDNWRFLFDRQMKLLPGRAGQAFLEGVEVLHMTPDRIPRLADLSARMEEATGWRIARIPGLLHERDFFRLLSERTFPSTDYIRGVEELDYTPAPDCFHDIFGHMPMLTEPAFADFYQLFGQAALHAEGADRPRLERLHWFTVEFGLIKQEEGTRIFGAGVMSSKNEVLNALSDKVERLSFDVERIVEQDYDVWHLQPILFELESFEQLVESFRDWTHAKGLL